mmetsp:Transcript_6346/g.7301  ORF Transcript_6346/g.7301 Transcript_6346/m.7301 type:complete len:246 (-) Transcript_6346:1327-2064(-)
MANVVDTSPNSTALFQVRLKEKENLEEVLTLGLLQVIQTGPVRGHTFNEIAVKVKKYLPVAKSEADNAEVSREEEANTKVSDKCNSKISSKRKSSTLPKEENNNTSTTKVYPVKRQKIRNILEVLSMRSFMEVEKFNGDEIRGDRIYRLKEQIRSQISTPLDLVNVVENTAKEESELKEIERRLEIIQKHVDSLPSPELSLKDSVSSISNMQKLENIVKSIGDDDSTKSLLKAVYDKVKNSGLKS